MPAKVAFQDVRLEPIPVFLTNATETIVGDGLVPLGLATSRTINALAWLVHQPPQSLLVPTRRQFLQSTWVPPKQMFRFPQNSPHGPTRHLEKGCDLVSRPTFCDVEKQDNPVFFRQHRQVLPGFNGDVRVRSRIRNSVNRRLCCCKLNVLSARDSAALPTISIPIICNLMAQNSYKPRAE